MTSTANQAQASRHILLNSIAWASFVTGFVGIFVPLLPTTIFWIVAAWCWLRSSPRMAFYILSHPRFGDAVSRFLEHGEMTQKGKLFAIAGIAMSSSLSLFILSPSALFVAIVASGLSLLGLWIWTRPEPGSRFDWNHVGAEAWNNQTSQSSNGE